MQTLPDGARLTWVAGKRQMAGPHRPDLSTLGDKEWNIIATLENIAKDTG